MTFCYKLLKPKKCVRCDVTRNDTSQDGVHSVVDPVVAAVLPVVKLFLMKPQINFLLGALHRVAAMHHVPARFFFDPGIEHK